MVTTHSSETTAPLARPSDPVGGPRREDGEGVLARVFREALRTPAYREILRLHVSEFQRGEGPALVRAVLREDPELWLGLASAAPRMVDSLVQSLAALGGELAVLPEPLVDSYLAQLAADIDRESLGALPVVWAPLLARALPGALNLAFESAAGLADALAGLDPGARASALQVALERVDGMQVARAINATAELVLALQREAPDVLTSAGGLDWTTLLRQVDAGRLREAVVALASAGRHSAQEVLTGLLGDPVIVANLVGALPPLLNDGLGLLTHVVGQLDLPDEVLASAIFNVLRALDLSELGRLTNGVAETLHTLHRGSAILGLEEPAFQAVCVELVDGLLDTLDLEAVARAAVALGEDGDVVVRVLARRIATDPKLLDQSVDTLATLMDQGVQTALQVVRELEHLPPGTREVVMARLGAMDGRALGELCNHLVELVESLGSGGPGTPALAGLLDTLDGPRARRLLWAVAAPLAQIVVGEAWDQIRRDPERLGREANGLLVRFNTWLQAEPDAADRFLARALVAVDGAELARAWQGGVRLVGRAVLTAGGGTGRLRPWLQLGARMVAGATRRSRRGPEGRG